MRSTLLLIPAALIALAVTACDSEEIGAAAVVGGERITVGELQSEVKAAAALPGSPVTLNGDDLKQHQTAILTEQVQGLVMAHVVEEAGIDVTGAEVDAFIEEQIVPQAPDGDLDAFLAQSGYTEERLEDLARFQISGQKLTQEMGGQEGVIEALTKAGKDLDVKINPRYGKWEGIEVNAVSGSVSRLADGGGAGASQ